MKLYGFGKGFWLVAVYYFGFWKHSFHNRSPEGELNFMNTQRSEVKLTEIRGDSSLRHLESLSDINHRNEVKSKRAKSGVDFLI